MRLFIAIEIDEAVRKRLAWFQDTLRNGPAKIKWVAPANIHLTLAFLGDVSPDRIEAIEDAMQTAVEGISPTRFTVRGAGSFGSKRTPRVIWVGLHEQTPVLESLYNALHGELETLGLALDPRPFSPHITLGRVRSAPNPGPLVDALKAAHDKTFGDVAAARVVLFQSTLTPDGPVYEVVRTVPIPA